MARLIDELKQDHVANEEVDAASLSRACRAKVESHFDIEQTAQKYLKLYGELVG